MSLFSRRLRAMSLALVVLVVLAGMPLYAQPARSPLVAPPCAGPAAGGAPVEDVADWADKMHELTTAQQEQLVYWQDRVNLPGPPRDRKSADATDAVQLDASPAAGSESALAESASADKAPLAPGDAQLYRNVAFGSVIPAGNKSNVLEPSLGTGGKYVFYTGNWFAARSTNGGSNWAYICLLYTSDAADVRYSVEPGGCRLI